MRCRTCISRRKKEVKSETLLSFLGFLTIGEIMLFLKINWFHEHSNMDTKNKQTRIKVYVEVLEEERKERDSENSID